MAHGGILGQTPNLNNLLPLDGSRSMTGKLQADAGIITGESSTSRIYNLTSRTITGSGGNHLTFNSPQIFRFNIDGTIAMDLSDDLNEITLSLRNNRITNLADGTSDTDAATVGQLNAAVANNISFITASNDDQSGVIISPTSLYVWMDDTLASTSKNFTKEYNIINKWYNLSGLLSHDKTQIDLTGNNGSSEKTIGWVKFSENNFEVYIDTVYCGFAHFGTFDYHS